MTWFALSVLSAFAFASADAATKRFFSDVDVWETAVVRFVLSGMIMLPWVIAEVEVPNVWQFWVWVGCLVPLDILAVYLYIRAITTAPLSHTLPYLALSPVFTALSGWLLLGEAVSLYGLSGIVLVSLGAYLLNTDSAELRRDSLAPLRFIATESGPRLMLGVAMIFSITSTLGKGAVQYMPGIEFGPFYAAVLAGATLCVVLGRRGKAFTIVHRRPIGSALVSGAMAVMFVAHFAAVERVEVAYMIAVKRSSLLFGLIYGAVLFKERMLGQNLLAGGIIITGVGLLTGIDP